MNEMAHWLEELRQQQIELWAEGDQLRFRAAKGALTPAIRQLLQERKGAVLHFLQKPSIEVITPTPVQESYELSQAQWRLWVLLQMERTSTAYHVPLHQLLEGALDRKALGLAFGQLIERHESLRTNFVLVAGEPRQVVRSWQSSEQFYLNFVDASDHPAPEQVARQLGIEQDGHPFDLEHDALMRATLVKLAEDRHLLLLTLHHIICDGVSIALLNRELSQLYVANLRGEANPLPALTLHYRDFAHWQNRWLASEATATQRSYWLQKLAGELPVLNLPNDFPRPVVQTFAGAELGFTLPPALLHGLRGLARQQGATLYMLLLAAVKVLLYRYSHQTDNIVGSPFAGRTQAELEGQIGFYLNTLALRDQFSAEQSFQSFLAQVKETVTAAFEYQSYPFDFLVNELKLQRDLSRSPLFDVIVILQNQRDRGLALGDLHVSPLLEHPGTSKVDLTFNFNEDVNGLRLGIEYNSDLFLPARIQRMGQHFCTLCESILADPAQSLATLDLLPPVEKEQVLVAFNQTAAPYPQDRTIGQLFAEQARLRPDALALVAGACRLSYHELNQRVNQMAWALQRDFALQPEDRIGVMLDRSEWLLVSILAVLKVGAAYVPVDPAQPHDRIEVILQDSGCKLLLIEPSYRDGFAALAGIQCCDPRLLQATETTEPTNQVSAEQIAYVMYTSGSTGRPKGVMVTHRNVVSFQANMQARFGLTAQDRIYALTTITFDISVLELINSLLTGMQVVLAPSAEIVEPAEILQTLAHLEITTLQVTPARLKMLLACEQQRWILQRLHVLLIGGEALSPALYEEVRLLCPAVAIFNVYGPTEATIWSTCQPISDGALTIGRPLLNEQVYILSPQQQVTPIGVVGEICIGGAGVAKGYFNRPELTAERFIRPQWAWQNRLYRTGDLGYWQADGTLVCLGRNDDQVKVRGFRVELGEIESHLRAHPAVKEAVVITVSERQEEAQLVACLLLQPGVTVTTNELRLFLSERLSYYMNPSLYRFLAAFPLTHNGKVSRKELRLLVEGESQPTMLAVLPRTATEQTLLQIWSTVLGNTAGSFGVEENFFDLGGHSLKAMRVIASIQREMGVRLNLADLFRNPTIASLAQVVDQQRLAEEPNLFAQEEMASLSALFPMGEPGLPLEVIAPMTEEELALLMEL